jgi:hypothetical protein
MRQLLAGLLALLPLFGAAQPAPAMRTAVQQLLESLPPDMRARALRPFDDADRADWQCCGTGSAATGSRPRRRSRRNIRSPSRSAIG